MSVISVMYSSFDVIIYPWTGWTSINFDLIGSSGIYIIFSTFERMSTCLLTSEGRPAGTDILTVIGDRNLSGHGKFLR